MSLLSFRSVCINVLLNSGIGAEFFMTCTFGIGMLYCDISLFTYVQIVVYFLNAAFQFYTSKVISLVLTLGGGARSWSATGMRGQMSGSLRLRVHWSEDCITHGQHCLLFSLHFSLEEQCRNGAYEKLPTIARTSQFL